MVAKTPKAGSKRSKSHNDSFSGGDDGSESDGGDCVVGGAPDLSWDALRRVFHLPCVDAASALGVAHSKLKRRCHKLKISRWPQRKLASLVFLRDALPNDTRLSESQREYIRTKIDEEYSLVMEDPNHPLDKELEQLRKSNYKLNYNRKLKGQSGVTKGGGSPSGARAAAKDNDEKWERIRGGAAGAGGGGRRVPPQLTLGGSGSGSLPDSVRADSPAWDEEGNPLSGHGGQGSGSGPSLGPELLQGGPSPRGAAVAHRRLPNHQAPGRRSSLERAALLSVISDGKVSKQASRRQSGSGSGSGTPRQGTPPVGLSGLGDGVVRGPGSGPGSPRLRPGSAGAPHSPRLRSRNALASPAAAALHGGMGVGSGLGKESLLDGMWQGGSGGGAGSQGGLNSAPLLSGALSDPWGGPLGPPGPAGHPHSPGLHHGQAHPGMGGMPTRMGSAGGPMGLSMGGAGNASTAGLAAAGVNAIFSDTQDNLLAGLEAAMDGGARLSLGVEQLSPEELALLGIQGNDRDLLLIEPEGGTDEGLDPLMQQLLSGLDGGPMGRPQQGGQRLQHQHSYQQGPTYQQQPQGGYRRVSESLDAAAGQGGGGGGGWDGVQGLRASTGNVGGMMGSGGLQHGPQRQHRLSSVTGSQQQQQRVSRFASAQDPAQLRSRYSIDGGPGGAGQFDEMGGMGGMGGGGGGGGGGYMGGGAHGQQQASGPLPRMGGGGGELMGDDMGGGMLVGGGHPGQGGGMGARYSALLQQQTEGRRSAPGHIGIPGWDEAQGGMGGRWGSGNMDDGGGMRQRQGPGGAGKGLQPVPEAALLNRQQQQQQQQQLSQQMQQQQGMGGGGYMGGQGGMGGGQGYDDGPYSPHTGDRGGVQAGGYGPGPGMGGALAGTAVNPRNMQLRNSGTGPLLPNREGSNSAGGAAQMLMAGASGRGGPTGRSSGPGILGRPGAPGYSPNAPLSADWARQQNLTLKTDADGGAGAVGPQGVPMGAMIFNRHEQLAAREQLARAMQRSSSANGYPPNSKAAAAAALLAGASSGQQQGDGSGGGGRYPEVYSPQQPTNSGGSSGPVVRGLHQHSSFGASSPATNFAGALPSPSMETIASLQGLRLRNDQDGLAAMGLGGMGGGGGGGGGAGGAGSGGGAQFGGAGMDMGHMMGEMQGGGGGGLQHHQQQQHHHHHQQQRMQQHGGGPGLGPGQGYASGQGHGGGGGGGPNAGGGGNAVGGGGGNSMLHADGGAHLLDNLDAQLGDIDTFVERNIDLLRRNSGGLLGSFTEGLNVGSSGMDVEAMRESLRRELRQGSTEQWEDMLRQLTGGGTA